MNRYAKGLLALLTLSVLAVASVGLLGQKPSRHLSNFKGTLVVYRIDDPEKETPYELFGTFITKRLAEKLPNFQVVSSPTDGSFDTLLKHEEVAECNAEDADSDEKNEQCSVETIGTKAQQKNSMPGRVYAIGLVQADVLFHYLNGSHPQFPFGKRTSSVRAIARVFPEWVHLYLSDNGKCNSEYAVETNCVPTGFWESGGTAQSQAVSSLSEISTACSGAEGSGSLVTAINIGQILHANWRHNLSECDSVDAKRTLSSSNRWTKTIGSALRILFNCFAQCWTSPGHWRNETSLRINVYSPRRSSGGSLGAITKGESLFLMTLAEAHIIANAFGGNVYRAVPRDERTDTAFEFQDGTEANADSFRNSTVSVDAILVGTRGLPEVVLDEVIKAFNEIDALSIAIDECRDSPELISAICADAPEQCNLIAKTAIAAYASTTDSVDESDLRLSPKRCEKLPVAMMKRLKIKQENRKFSNLLIDISDFTVGGEKWRFSLIRISVALLFIGIATNQYFKFRQKKTGIARSLRHRAVSLIMFAFLFVALHWVIGIFVWLSEFHAVDPRPPTKLVTGGAWQGIKWVTEFAALGGATEELRSGYSLVWVAILKGGYVISGLIAGVTVLQWINSHWENFTMSKHIIVLGWNCRAQIVIDELKRQKKSVMHLITSEPNGGEYSKSHEGVDVICKETIKEGLVKANPRRASGIIVLANKPKNSSKSEEDQPDLWVLRALGLLKSEMDKIPNAKRPFIVAEIEDGRNNEAARALGAREVLIIGGLEASIAAQSAVKEDGLLSIYSELVKTKDTDNEIYFYRLSNEEVKYCKTFESLASQLLTLNNAVVLLGLRVLNEVRTGDIAKARSIKLNPIHRALQPGDEAIILSKDKPKAGKLRIIPRKLKKPTATKTSRIKGKT